MNYMIVISYDGSKFFGFQRLNEEISVQKVLEDALTKINKQSVEVKGAGRTDRGVHACGQCVSFTLNINISEDGLNKALNSLVGPYIYVRKVKKVDDNFHARFSVLKKKYIYKINLGEYNPILADYIYQSHILKHYSDLIQDSNQQLKIPLQNTQRQMKYILLHIYIDHQVLLYY